MNTPANRGPLVRIVCDDADREGQPRHREITIANYERLHDDDPRYDRPVWVWDEAMGQGGSRIETSPDGILRARESIDRRKVTYREAAEGRRFAEAHAKRFVRDLDETSDNLECAKCGQRLTVNRERLEKYLDSCVDNGVSKLGLPALARIVRQ
ncbi:MAG: hypothetical protein JWP11_1503 [Frankiales bacterium]|nr:hypothetical protein [Frankiales bacterium]